MACGSINWPVVVRNQKGEVATSPFFICLFYLLVSGVAVNLYCTWYHHAEWILVMAQCIMVINQNAVDRYYLFGNRVKVVLGLTTITAAFAYKNLK